MKNMTRVMQDAFVTALRTAAQTSLVNRALVNQDAEHLKHILSVELCQDNIARGKCKFY